MRTILLLLAVGALSILASSRAALRVSKALALTQLSTSGLSFLALGVLLGPGAFALFPSRVLTDLMPLVSTGLGFAGVLIGLNLDVRFLRRLPVRLYGAAVAHSAGGFGWVAVPLALVLATAGRLPLPEAVGTALLLGAAASVSSGQYAVLWYRAGRMHRSSGLGVALLAMLDDLMGLLVYGAALAAFAMPNPLQALWSVLLALLLGGLCGLLLSFLIRGAEARTERTAILLAGVALISGAAAYLRMSALWAGVGCGAAVALVGGWYAEQTYQALRRLERPLYLMLVFLVGAQVTLNNPWTYAILVAFVSLRLFGKLWGGKFAVKLAGVHLSLPPVLGFALIPQGGTSLCIVMEYMMLNPSPSAALALNVVVLSALLNEVITAQVFGLSWSARSIA